VGLVQNFKNGEEQDGLKSKSFVRENKYATQEDSVKL